MLIAAGVVALLLAGVGLALSVVLTFRVNRMLDHQFDTAKWRPESIPKGTLVGDYPKLVDVDGRPWQRAGEDDEPWVLSFLSMSCTGCKEQMPRYLKFLRDHNLSREQAISVVVGDDSDLEALNTELGATSRIVRIEEAAQIVVDLKVTTWPTYAIVAPDSTVAFATGSVTRLAHRGLAV
ncbi:hypothetical protein OG588_32505 [Streptomyces prunicolor]|uniref:TlpA family protein disulfide reductase n=1 Tax=Streptomyces prunicolor TaxID=67348 RepID=UPI00386D6EED|nr:hypothetical protein OG588_32505 [Streptomyces prunicolor]